MVLQTGMETGKEETAKKEEWQKYLLCGYMEARKKKESNTFLDTFFTDKGKMIEFRQPLFQMTASI